MASLDDKMSDNRDEDPKPKWSECLRPYDGSGAILFGEKVLETWSPRLWEPHNADKLASALLHTQLVSRITTQALGYSHGVESSALSSIYALFDATRRICERQPRAHHFSDIAWHILNTHVRPFTAKWHRRDQAGLLRSLDATDEFRADLATVQPVLRAFDRLLVDLRGGPAAPSGEDAAEIEWVAREVREPLAWGVGTLDALASQQMDDDELSFINARRTHYEIESRHRAVGLALSGGGIRSATFSLGVLAALARRNILPQVDYLSTVSGGGFVGAFLAAFLESNEPAATTDAQPADGQAGRPANAIGMRAGERPFSKAPRESRALGHIRQNSRYLAASSPLEQWQLALSQLSGLLLNLLALTSIVAALALGEHWLREAVDIGDPGYRTVIALGILAAGLVISPVLLRLRMPGAELGIAVAGLGALVLLCWTGLPWVHGRYADLLAPSPRTASVALGLPLILLYAGILGERLLPIGKWAARLMAKLAMPLFVAAGYLTIYWFYDGYSGLRFWIAIGIAAVVAYLFLIVDVNLSGLHRHYRRKLAGTFLIQAQADKILERSDLKLSQLGARKRSPYPLINAALNLPSSKLPEMRGRLASFFCFSPLYCGSGVTGYLKTEEWEKANRDLDLGAAMAISGAAASAHMGILTPRPLSFWLALLNVRLNYWLRRPGPKWSPAGAWLLLREMFGRMDETLPRLNLSDGGHIENLGVYELLRRRCKFIIAIDGEQDPRMTFNAITNLQRLAAIDLGVAIDIDLEDLRLDDKGLSRSHFRFARIHYPGGTGYLLYVKLSLTGNEGEFLRRYKLDEPDFPHHSTANQFFTEAQFEAYRSLGEHIGDKLFLRAVLKDLTKAETLCVDDWFEKIAESFLDPPAAN